MMIPSRTTSLIVAAAAFGLASAAYAVNPHTSSAFQTVNVDGNTVFADGTSVSVVQDGGVYTMFYRNFGTDDGSIGQLRSATSVDGINYTGGAGGTFSSDPFTGGTAPYLYYENVSRVGGSLKVQHWTYNGGAGSFPNYNYNISVSDAGAVATNVYAHQGPVSGGTEGQTAGSFGIVGGNLYGQGGTGRQMQRGAYNDGTTSVASWDVVADFQALFDSLGISDGYINNHSDVLDLGSSLGLYFTVRDSGGNRLNKQIYFSESFDGGTTWNAATGILSNAPTLDGGAFGLANFAHADAVAGGVYISGTNLNGDYITAFIPSPGALALLGLGGLVVGRRRR